VGVWQVNPEFCYHLLEIGVIYEKGGKQGDHCRMEEKKRLLDECALWRNLIQYAAWEESGVDVQSAQGPAWGG